MYNSSHGFAFNVLNVYPLSYFFLKDLFFNYEYVVCTCVHICQENSDLGSQKKTLEPPPPQRYRQL